MKQNGFEKIVFYISRTVIIIPVVVIFFGLFIFAKEKNAQLKVLNAQQKPTTQKVATNAPKTISSQATASSERIVFSLQGPLVCQYQSNEASMSALIKNKKVIATNKVGKKASNYLLVDECLYIWEEGNNTGRKICELSQYIKMFETLSSFGILNAESLFDIFSQLGLKPEKLSNLPKENIGAEFSKSCKKREVNDEVFKVPLKVSFKNEKFSP